ncbi:MAG: hypothetical protein Q9177_005790 [Variospora cf. flavescens]
MGSLPEPLSSWLSFRTWTLLFLLYSPFFSRASAIELPEPRYVSWNPPTLMVDETSSLAATAENVAEPQAFGIQLDYRPVPILPQAVGGILTQAMFKAFLELGPSPLTVSNSFSHGYSEMIESRICFDVGVTMTATANMTGFYTMTNRRIATVLSLMGFDFARHEDVNRLREYNFNVVVERGSGNVTVIGQGTLRNGVNAQPIIKDNRKY